MRANWTQHLVSDTLRSRNGSDIQLREPSIDEVLCTADKPVRFSPFPRFFFIADPFSCRETFTLERSHLPTQESRAHRHYHSSQLPLLPQPRHFMLSLVPLGQHEHSRVQISPLPDGVLVLWPGFAVYAPNTPTVNIRDTVATTASADFVKQYHCHIDMMLDFFLTIDQLWV